MSGKRLSLDLPETALGLHSQVRAFCPLPMGSRIAFMWGGPSNSLSDVRYWLLSTGNGQLPRAPSLLGFILRTLSIVCINLPILIKSK